MSSNCKYSNSSTAEITYLKCMTNIAYLRLKLHLRNPFFCVATKVPSVLKIESMKMLINKLTNLVCQFDINLELKDVQ